MDLGMFVQGNLKFDKHINSTVNRANRLVELIKRAFSYLDIETLLILYDFYQTILDYGKLIWYPTLKKDIRAIKNIQRRKAGLGGSVGCAVRLETRRSLSQVQPAEVGNILSWRLIMKYFLLSFSPFR